MIKASALLTFATVLVFALLLYFDWQRPDPMLRITPIAVGCSNEAHELAQKTPLRWTTSERDCESTWIRFVAETSEQETRLAVYLPRVSSPVVTVIDGNTVAYTPSIQQHAFIPLPIPASAVVHLIIDSKTQQAGFVGDIYLGPGTALRPSFLMGQGSRQIVNQFTTFTSFVLSLLALVLWWQGGDGRYGQMGLALLGICVYSGLNHALPNSYANAEVLFAQHLGLALASLSLISAAPRTLWLTACGLCALAAAGYTFAPVSFQLLLGLSLLAFIAVRLVAGQPEALRGWAMMTAGLACLYLLAAATAELSGWIPWGVTTPVLLIVLLLTSLSWSMTTGFIQSLKDRIQSLERQQAVNLERRRIMRDMHDGVGNQLVSIIVQLQNGTPDQREIMRLTKDALTELRLIIDALSDEEADLGAQLGMLRMRLGERLEAAGIHCGWKVSALPVSLSPGTTHQLLRIVQEGITNVIKHADADNLILEVERSESLLTLSLRDDGIGMREPASGGYGLRNLRQRATEIGAHIEWLSNHPSGTELRVSLPLAGQNL